MIVSYHRAGGIQPPPDQESFQIEDDGSYSMWRSIGWATIPPTPVGRFQGQVSAGVLADLDREIDAAERAGNIQIISRPGSPIENIQLAHAKAVLATHDKPTGDWIPLVARVRGLLGELTNSPLAAVALKVAADGKSAQLVHLGNQPLRIDLRALTLRADLYSPADSNILKEWRAPKGHPAGMVTAEPGWVFDMPFDHGFAVTAGLVVRAFSTFTIFDGTTPVPVSIKST